MFILACEECKKHPSCPREHCGKTSSVKYGCSVQGFIPHFIYIYIHLIPAALGEGTQKFTVFSMYKTPMYIIDHVNVWPPSHKEATKILK